MSPCRFVPGWNEFYVNKNFDQTLDKLTPLGEDRGTEGQRDNGISGDTKPSRESMERIIGRSAVKAFRRRACNS